jgi:iron complex transport system substrate-binding protein
VRIASLVPAGTDLVVALGLADYLVAVSHSCDHPAVAGVPVVTASTLPSGLGPAEVDRAVQETAEAGGHLYRANVEALRRLAPDVVVSQSVCDVCALNAERVRDDLPPGAQLVDLRATSLARLEEDVLAVGRVTATEQGALALVESLRVTRRAVEGRVSGRPRPRVLALEWGDPPFIGGHWVPELIAAAGGQSVLGSPGAASRRAGWDEVAAAEPEVVVFMPCGYGLDDARAEGEAVARKVPASTAVWATDAARLFSRCTPDAVASGLEVLAGILHPEAFPTPSHRLAVRLSRARVG